MIRSDTYTIAELCRMSGISESTYHYWKSTKSEFLQSVKTAEASRNDYVVCEAKKSLIKKVTGWNFNERKIVTIKQLDGTAKEVSETVTTKHYPPDTAAIIFTLCNLDPEHYKQTSALRVGVSLPEGERKPAIMRLPDGTEIEL